MDTGKIYYDSDGNECSIVHMVQREPNWAANRVQEGERAIELLRKQYHADKDLYELPSDCAEDEHRKAIQAHDDIHAKVAAFFGS